MNKIKNKLLFSIIFGIIVFVALSVYADIDNVITAFYSFKWVYIPLILFLTFLNYLLRFLKWEYYVTQVGISISKRDSLIVFFSGLTGSVTPAKLGEALKSYLLKKLNGTPISKSIPIIFAERLTDTIGLIILACISFSAFRYGKEVLFVTLTSILVLILIIQSKKYFMKLLGFAERVPFISKFTRNLHVLYDGTYQLLGFKNLLIAIFISVLSWFFECIALFFVLKGFGVDASLLISTFAFAFSSVAGAVSMIPGGLGVAEGGITGLLILSGTQKPIAVGSALIIRFCTLWFGVLIGAITLFVFRKKFVSK